MEGIRINLLRVEDYLLRVVNILYLELLDLGLMLRKSVLIVHHMHWLLHLVRLIQAHLGYVH